MVARKTHHKKQALKLLKKKEIVKAPKVKKAGAGAFIGKPYSAEELQSLISALTSFDVAREIAAVVEFAENQERISATTAQTPDVSDTKLLELIIAAVQKNEELILKSFEEKKSSKALTFLADSSAVPEKVRERATAVIKRMPLNDFAEKVKAPSVKADIAQKNNFTPKEVKVLITKLDSSAAETKIQGAIEFIKEYPRITPTISEMPLLTVTSITIKAVEVIKNNSEPILQTMVQKKMFAELMFLASLGQVPITIRKKAEKAVEILRPEVPNLVAVTEEIKKEPQKAETPQVYSPMQLEALLGGFGSVERVRVVKSAVEFLKNYDIIVQAIAQAPLLTVTDVTTKAVLAIESNLSAILRELQNRREINALRFLAHSEKFSKETRERATKILSILIQAIEGKGGEEGEEEDEEKEQE